MNLKGRLSKIEQTIKNQHSEPELTDEQRAHRITGLLSSAINGRQQYREPALGVLTILARVAERRDKPALLAGMNNLKAAIESEAQL